MIDWRSPGVPPKKRTEVPAHIPTGAMSKLQHDQVPDLLLHSIGDPLWCIGRARFVGPTRRGALHTLHICSLKAMIRPGWTSSKSQVDGIEWSRDVRNPPKVRRFRGRSCGRGPFARWDENNGLFGAR